MKLSLSLAVAAVLTGAGLTPTTAQAAPQAKHREATFRLSDHHHHHHHYQSHSRLVRVWVRGHSFWRHGHRHWVPGHYEWRRIYF